MFYGLKRMFKHKPACGVDKSGFTSHSDDILPLGLDILDNFSALCSPERLR